MSSNLKDLSKVALLLLGALSFGTVTSYPSPAIMSLTNENPQLAEDRFKNYISWFSNAPRLSAGIGPFLFIIFLPKLGRKKCLSITSFLLGICWFLLFLMKEDDKYNDVPFNIIYGIIIRTIMGLFWGAMACLTVIYIIELSPQDSVGLFGSLYQLFIILGICLNNILGAFVDWKILIIIGGVINFIYGICVLLMEDSPVSKKLKTQKYHLKKFCCSKFQCFCCLLCDKKTNVPGVNSSYVSNVISSMAMLFFQQYCGINAILNNLSSIMILSGLDINPNLQSALATLAQFLACLIACFLMDSVGAKKLWIVSSIGCLISLAVYSYCIFNMQNLLKVPGYIPVLSVFVYCLFFGLGQGPAPWVVFPADFPDVLRYEGVCMMMLSHWFVSFIVCYTHPIITERVGEFYAILIYIICSVGSIIYGFICIPKKENIYNENFSML